MLSAFFARKNTDEPPKPEESVESIILRKFRSYTMLPDDIYLDNLRLTSRIKHLEGDVVECGVWRGGIIAGMAEILRDHRTYWLLDSFEGLPPAQEIDGDVAIRWQQNRESPSNYNNCTAEEGYAIEAMNMVPGAQYKVVKGWFEHTMNTAGIGKIALLRLDGDWYESTMTCLEGLYSKVVDGGIIIIDDYYYWDGCCKAVHDFLSRNSLRERIHESPKGVAYIVKNSSTNRHR